MAFPLGLLDGDRHQGGKRLHPLASIDFPAVETGTHALVPEQGGLPAGKERLKPAQQDSRLLQRAPLFHQSHEMANLVRARGLVIRLTVGWGW